MAVIMRRTSDFRTHTQTPASVLFSCQFYFRTLWCAWCTKHMMVCKGRMANESALDKSRGGGQLFLSVFLFLLSFTV